MNRKGITLIVLVITVVVLLILAGTAVTIGLNGGDLFEHTDSATGKWNDASFKEQIVLSVLSSYDEDARLNVDRFKSYIRNAGGIVIGSKFPFTVTIQGKKYTVNSNMTVQELNGNEMTITELQEDAKTYFGYDVINYASTLSENFQDTTWQLFYAGALEGETEEKIYLISKEYIKNTQLPKKNGIAPTAGDNEYKAYFSNSLLSQYSGSSGITDEECKKLNRLYFEYLQVENKTSARNNIRMAAYMLDTTTWNDFKGDYAQFVIGGPTIELLFTAYNKYNGTNYEKKVENEMGYVISKDGGGSWNNYYGYMIEDDSEAVDNPYSVINLSDQADAYWIASPSARSQQDVFIVGNYNGNVCDSSYYYGNGTENHGFRPIVVLKSDYTLEKTMSNGKEVFQIVEK